MHNELAQAIVQLTEELREARAERRRGLATSRDVRESEARIIEAIGKISTEDQNALNNLLARVEASTRKLERLDDLSPNS